MKIEDIKERILFLEKQSRANIEEIHNLTRACPHEYECVDCKSGVCESQEQHAPDDDWTHGVARCRGCQRYGGYFCETSPDHLCHYYTLRLNEAGYGVILLADKTEYTLHTKHDREYESDDFCFFCGQPEERK